MCEEFFYFRSVGTATAAFALAILEGSTQPGVWFPEEVHKMVKKDLEAEVIFKHYISYFKFLYSLKELRSRLEKFYSSVRHKERLTL